MRIRFIFIWMSVMMSLIGLPSCDKDSNVWFPVDLSREYKAGSPLVQVWMSSSGETAGPLYLNEVYEYDKDGRIIKVSRPTYNNNEIGHTGWYNEYTYNEKGQLVKIAYWVYNRDETFHNLTITAITYNDRGLKVEEVVGSPDGLATDKKTFEYDKGLLSRQNVYDHSGALLNYTKYEYDKEGRLSKETVYGPKSDKPHQYSLYSYENGLNTQVDVYRSVNLQKEYELLRRITKEYDKNNNLVRLSSKEIWMASSMSSYVLFYEYADSGL